MAILVTDSFEVRIYEAFKEMDFGTKKHFVRLMCPNEKVSIRTKKTVEKLFEKEIIMPFIQNVIRANNKNNEEAYLKQLKEYKETKNALA